MNLDITSWIFVVAIALVATTSFVGFFFLSRKRKLWRWPVLSLALLLTLATAAAGVNSYFEYFPTPNTLLGNYKDSASLKAFRSGALSAQLRMVKHGANGTAIPKHGVVVSIPIPATLSRFPARSAEIYVPPAWFVDPQPHLPVIELFHGTPGTPQDWVRGGGVPELSDAWAMRHSGYAPVVVMPDINGSVLGDSECVDGKVGLVETYLTQDVRNFAISELHVSTDRSAWSTAGLSEGGYCAAMLALRHPSQYSNFLDLGGDDRATKGGGMSGLFAGPPSAIAQQANSYSLRTLLANRTNTTGMGAWFISGSDDKRVARTCKELNALALAHGVDSHLFIIPDSRHTFHTWKVGLAVSYPYTAARIQPG